MEAFLKDAHENAFGIPFDVINFVMGNIGSKIGGLIGKGTGLIKDPDDIINERREKEMKKKKP